MFGVPLEVAVSRSKIADGIELPTVFRECIYYLEEKGRVVEFAYMYILLMNNDQTYSSSSFVIYDKEFKAITIHFELDLIFSI